MRKIIWRNGLIAGTIVTLIMLLSMMYVHKSGNMNGNMLVMFAGMLIGFAFIFVAVRHVREQHMNGVIRYGKAFLIGLYVSLIASTMYVIGWAFEYHLYMPDFMEKYSMSQISDLYKLGLSPEKMQAEIVRILIMLHKYRDFSFFVAITYMEILPVGIVVSLLAALIQTRSKKGPIPFSNAND